MYLNSLFRFLLETILYLIEHQQALKKKLNKRKKLIKINLHSHLNDVIDQSQVL
jgi:hypothetical protein